MLEIGFGSFHINRMSKQRNQKSDREEGRDKFIVAKTTIERKKIPTTHFLQNIANETHSANYFLLSNFFFLFFFVVVVIVVNV